MNLGKFKRYPNLNGFWWFWCRWKAVNPSFSTTPKWSKSVKIWTISRTIFVCYDIPVDELWCFEVQTISEDRYHRAEQAEKEKACRIEGGHAFLPNVAFFLPNGMLFYQTARFVPNGTFYAKWHALYPTRAFLRPQKGDIYIKSMPSW